MRGPITIKCGIYNNVSLIAIILTINCVLVNLGHGNGVMVAWLSLKQKALGSIAVLALVLYSVIIFHSSLLSDSNLVLGEKCSAARATAIYKQLKTQYEYDKMLLL